MPFYEDVRIEILNEGSWLDISSAVDSEQMISFSRGIMGNSVTDRTARVGSMTFVVLDQSGTFDPINTAKVLQNGTEVRIVFRHEGIERVLWYGAVDEVFPRQDGLFLNRARISAKCVLDQFNRPVTTLITTNKTTSEVVAEISAILGMALSDDQQKFGVMSKIFPTVFDTVKQNQNGLSEISKAVMSELGYFYARGTRDLAANFVLTIDGKTSRSGYDFINIPKGADESEYLEAEDGTYILQENGERILLDEVEEMRAFDELRAVGLGYGKNIINECLVTVYPRKVSPSTVVLFAIENALSIDAGETLEMVVRYRDPDQEAQSITARTTILPESGIDFEANAADDRSGADLTASLTVTAVYSAADIAYTLQNTGAVKLYVTKLQARGQGIFFYSSLTARSQDTASQAANGYRLLQLNLRYLEDVSEAALIAETIVAKAKDIFQEVETIDVYANASSQTLFGALFLDIGDPIEVPVLDSSGASAMLKHYINGVSWSGQNGYWHVRYQCAPKEVVEL
jgi:hypothetical protein